MHVGGVANSVHQQISYKMVATNYPGSPVHFSVSGFMTSDEISYVHTHTHTHTHTHNDVVILHIHIIIILCTLILLVELGDSKKDTAALLNYCMEASSRKDNPCSYRMY